MFPNKLSDYEKQRLRNIEENRKVLLSLGLIQQTPCQAVGKKPISIEKAPQKKRKHDVLNGREKQTKEDFNYELPSKVRKRRSLRVLGVAPENSENLVDISADEDTVYRPSQSVPVRENSFGAIPGIPVGAYWELRIDCSRDGVHRPTVAGIHGSAEEGCYSLALSGGYEDDIDMGDRFTYTGEGGRDLKGTKAKPKNLRTAAQSKNQTLTKGNLALTLNVENRRPVRVIRGYKLKSEYAPESGYRYDGLYTVEKFWEAVGLSGYVVYKFALKRCPDQDPPPWQVNNNVYKAEEDEETKAEIKNEESCGRK